ncbi:MAG: AAA family ATPase [Alphaproteobacteria bacterium]|nr:AAA family ATPase [Alphaproteobacteria bacterium]MCW5738570.1 AAA family ATPase [Alphaproteobacteria bacterium]
MKLSNLARFDTIDPTAWQDRPVPPRRWLVPDMLVRGNVTLLSGDGGVGKSLLAQQLATSLALGRPFLGIPTQPAPVPVLALFCEDDGDELHFRQDRINARYGCQMRDLGALTLVSRVAMANELMVFGRNDIGEETALYHQLETRIRESGAQLIVVDTVADTFMGNEIIRPQVRQFLTALRRLALINDGAVLLTGHPSLTGLNSGSGLSGSTAWHNTVRGRLYLTHAPAIDGSEEESNDARILKLMKNNYGPSGSALKLTWREHVFVPQSEAPRARTDTVDRLEIDNAVLAGLRKLVGDGVLVPADSHARNGLAVRLRAQAACRRWNWHSLIAAQERLVAAGRIVKVELGSASKRRLYVRPHDTRLPGEVSVGSAEE